MKEPVVTAELLQAVERIGSKVDFLVGERLSEFYCHIGHLLGKQIEVLRRSDSLRDWSDWSRIPLEEMRRIEHLRSRVWSIENPGVSAGYGWAPDPLGNTIGIFMHQRPLSEQATAGFRADAIRARQCVGYLVSEAVGLHVVPPTVGHNGSIGLDGGVLQLWVPNTETGKFRALGVSADSQWRLAIFHAAMAVCGESSYVIRRDRDPALLSIFHGISCPPLRSSTELQLTSVYPPIKSPFIDRFEDRTIPSSIHKILRSADLAELNRKLEGKLSSESAQGIIDRLSAMRDYRRLSLTGYPPD